MKKKGLIVATIVMVLVLAVSLTTATYAWFTSSSTVEIDTIDFSVTSGGDVMIGVKANNQFTDGAKSAASYYNGTTVYTPGETFADPGKWESETQGLGYNIDFATEEGALSFSGTASEPGMTKAIGTGIYSDADGASSADSSFVLANYLTGMIMAEGNSEGATESSIDKAWKQKNYLDVVIGVQVARNDLTDLSCYVTINPTDAVGTNMVGMNAAIHCVWAVNGAALQDKDIYEEADGDKIPYTTTNNNVTNVVTADNLNDLGGGNTALNKGAMTFKIELGAAEEGQVLTVGEIYEVHLIIFVAGYDSDCIDPAKGVGATINITFGGTRLEPAGE